MGDPLHATPVEREEIGVMFVRTADDPLEFGPAFQRLEELVGTRGRKFYGAFYPREKEYRACVVIKDGDDATALGLEEGALPGGRYLRARLRGEPPALYRRIAPAFDALVSRTPTDETRPSLEFYRRHDEIELLLPVPDQ
ncbi:MAG TPA: GyrI-like domain-containing protein [Gaiellaceae bacterium]|nr:GyrI-like domain-containing protein [Gaiellaceae bacterium]